MKDFNQIGESAYDLKCIGSLGVVHICVLQIDPCKKKFSYYISFLMLQVVNRSLHDQCFLSIYTNEDSFTNCIK